MIHIIRVHVFTVGLSAHHARKGNSILKRYDYNDVHDCRIKANKIIIIAFSP